MANRRAAARSNWSRRSALARSRLFGVSDSGIRLVIKPPSWPAIDKTVNRD
ncbi:Uncharacterised protein [Mycobacteroides abscessus subsp. abscessus]|nr:Uncharacterised protein [Mycobacteroides abscessus subsp. abscessus]